MIRYLRTIDFTVCEQSNINTHKMVIYQQFHLCNHSFENQTREGTTWQVWYKKGQKFLSFYRSLQQNRNR